MCVAYFVHELQDPAVLKRVKMVAAGGGACVLLGFQRQRFDQSAEGADSVHMLGRTQNQRFIARAFAVLFALPRAWALRRHWAAADIILARNLEMLALVSLLRWFVRTNARVIYECLDIHRLMLGQGMVSVILRSIERACLKHAALVLTSSPAFVERYFRPRQGFVGDALIVENKVLALDDAPRASASPQPTEAPPWKIAWCGVLRCRKSFDLLVRLADKLNGRLEIELWGAPAYDQIPDFDDKVAASPWINFHGRYAAADLARIYGGAHFVWAVDYYEAGGNSDWLLPNRLYEGLANAAVPIAIDGVETARWLGARQLGVVLSGEPAEALEQFLSQCTPERYRALRAAIEALDPAATALSRNDCRAMLARFAGGETRRAA